MFSRFELFFFMMFVDGCRHFGGGHPGFGVTQNVAPVEIRRKSELQVRMSDHKWESLRFSSSILAFRKIGKKHGGHFWQDSLDDRKLQGCTDRLHSIQNIPSRNLQKSMVVNLKTFIQTFKN